MNGIYSISKNGTYALGADLPESLNNPEAIMALTDLLSEVRADWSKRVNEAYKKGLKEGANHSNATKSDLDHAYNSGHMDGYFEGYNIGYKDGEEEGYAEGKEVGYAAGYEEGSILGW